MKIKKLILCILIPLGLGVIVGLLTSGNSSYQEIIKPSFSPPAILFPIVWTILYILMGISSYLVLESGHDLTKKALTIYGLQLFVNLSWSFFFFTFNLYGFSFIWLLLLLFLVLSMINIFGKINKISSYLQIPYYLWLLFAAVLNLSIAFLN